VPIGQLPSPRPLVGMRADYTAIHAFPASPKFAGRPQPIADINLMPTLALSKHLRGASPGRLYPVPRIHTGKSIFTLRIAESACYNCHIRNAT